MDILSFPNIGLSFKINKIAFHIFGLPIYWYSILIGTGVLLAIIYTQKRSKQFGIHSDGFFDATIGGIVAGVIGARLFYVIFAWEEFRGNFLKVFEIRGGGLAIYGGIIIGSMAGYFISKWRGFKPLPALDLAGLGFLIGQGIGRWGNFVNMEAFGNNTTLPWGMTSKTIESFLRNTQPKLESMGIMIDPTMPVHPTFLYESLWCGLGFLILHFYSKKRRYDGEIFTLYISWYSLGRFFIEGLRTDSLYAGNLRVSRLIAALLFVVSITSWIAIRSRIKRENDDEFMKLYSLTSESKTHIEETESKLNTIDKKKIKKEAEAEILDETKADEIKEANQDDKEKITEEKSMENTLSEDD